MRATYTRLFTVRVRHGFYADGRARGALAGRPTAATAGTLKALGLGFRTLPDGFTVYGETDGATPPRLLRGLGHAPLHLAFLLEPASPHLASITALPAFRPTRQVLCFDNLREDVVDGRAHLGDAVAGRRLGELVALVAASVVTYRFEAPVRGAALTVRDRFGATVGAETFALPAPGDRADGWRIALGETGVARPDRYVVEDDHGGRMPLWYAPDLGPAQPLAIADIFSSSVGLATGPERVPPSYRFLAPDGIVTPREYHVQLEPRATTWRYTVVRRYAPDDAILADLTIAGGVAFTRTLGTGRAVFTSNAPVPLSERPPTPPLELRDATRKLRDLPPPAATTPLRPGDAPASFASELFVYV